MKSARPLFLSALLIPLAIHAGESRKSVELEAVTVRTTDIIMRRILQMPDESWISSTVLSQEQFVEIMATLKNEKARFSEVQRGATWSGQDATLSDVRAFPYPSRFEQSKDPSGKVFPKTFAMRDVGTTVKVQPEVFADNPISLKIDVKVVDFRGLVNFSTDKSTRAKGTDPSDRVLNGPRKEGDVVQPVFSESSVTTTIDLYAGSTALVCAIRPLKPLPSIPRDPYSTHPFVFVTARVISP